VNSETCPRCQQLHASAAGARACTGHRRRDGAPCTKNALAGQDVCRSHGGGSPQAKAAAVRRVTEQKAEAIMGRFAGPVDTTPTRALLDSVRWVAGYVEFLREQVARITNDATDVDDLIWGKTKHKTGGDDAGTTEEAKPSAWDALLGTWQERLTKLCTEAIRAGIEERRVRLAEQQGALVADVIRGILGELALTPEQAARVPEVVPRHLRLLIGGAS
jgi:hypothetical protein